MQRDHRALGGKEGLGLRSWGSDPSIHCFVQSAFTEPGHVCFCVWYQRSRNEWDVPPSPPRNLESPGGGERGAHSDSDSVMQSEKWLVPKVWNRCAET